MSDVLPSPVISFNTLNTTDQKSPLPTSQASSPCGSDWTHVPLNTCLHNYIIIAHPIILATLRKPLEIRWKFARNSQLTLVYICLIHEIVYFVFNPAGEWCVLLFCDETMTVKVGRIHFAFILGVQTQAMNIEWSALRRPYTHNPEQIPPDGVTIVLNHLQELSQSSKSSSAWRVLILCL